MSYYHCNYLDQIHKRMMNDKSNLKNHNRSRSESSVIEDIKSQSTESKKDQIHKRMMNDKSNLKNHNRSRSESSVIEDIKSQSTESKK